MEKVKCPQNEKVIVDEEYIKTHCMTRCGLEQFQKCLEMVRKNNEEKITDEVVLEPSIFYLGFDNLGTA